MEQITLEKRLSLVESELQKSRVNGCLLDRTKAMETGLKGASSEDIATIIKMGQGSWSIPNERISVLDLKEFQHLKNDKEFILNIAKESVFNFDYASDKIRNLYIDKPDPVKALESAIAYEKLQRNLKPKEEFKQTQKLKI